MGQVVGSESVLLFDDVSQDEPEGVSLHQLIKPVLVLRKNVRREEELFGRIFSEDLKTPAPEHALHRRRIFKKRGPHRGHVSGEGIHFPLERFNFFQDLFVFHGRPMVQNCFPIRSTPVQNNILTAETLRTQRGRVSFGGEPFDRAHGPELIEGIPPNQK